MENITPHPPTTQFFSTNFLPEGTRRARWKNQWIHIPETPKVDGGPDPTQPIYLRPTRENPGGFW